MTKHLLFLIISFCFSSTSYSQTNNTIIRMHYLVPGITIEQRINEFISLSYDLSSSFHLYYININGKGESELSFTPYMRFEPRFYHSIKKRNLIGKKTENLSSGYVSIQFLKSFPTQKIESWYSYGMIVGFQRMFGNEGYFDIGIGIGATTIGYNTSITPLGNFHLGIILFPNKKN